MIKSDIKNKFVTVILITVVKSERCVVLVELFSIIYKYLFPAKIKSCQSKAELSFAKI